MSIANTHNASSIEQFLIQSEKRAFVMARFATRDDEAALDIVQDAMLKLVSKYADKTADDWHPLFYRILQSRINDWHRRQQVANRWRSWFGKVKNQSDDGEIRDPPLENQPDGNTPLPDAHIGCSEFSESLRVAIADLPMRQQQAFMLRAWEECSTRETSRIMQCSEGSVKTHYSRALAALREQLQEHAIDTQH